MRLFMAFSFPAAISQSIDEEVHRLRAVGPDLRWVAGGNRHLTLVFLGEVEAERQAPLEAALSETCSRHRRFELELKGGGTFGARVLWLGLEGAVDALSALQAELAQRVRALGVELED